MFYDSKIIGVNARTVLDSRGNPTVEAEIKLQSGIVGRGISPSGASTGEHEALELRDVSSPKYGGKGVQRAVSNVNSVIAAELIGRNAREQQAVDEAMIRLDGTKDKSNLGANAILAVSLACARASAALVRQPLYRYIGGVSARNMPTPMMNVLNGGAHASNNIDIQEFMIVPVGAESFREGLRQCSEVYHKLAEILRGRGMSASLGDEGGFAPNLKDDTEAIELILTAVELAGYKAPNDFMIALDVAAGEWTSEDAYKMPKHGIRYSASELIRNWINLCARYPIMSLEDPLGEDDWNGWRRLTSEFRGMAGSDQVGKMSMLVGDDLFVTNTERLQYGIEFECADAILIKLNQIGTLSETLQAVRMAKNAGYKTIISHRSGETEDTFIADLAVGVNAPYIKSGAPARTDRVAKYNRLCRIEEELSGVIL